MACWGESVRKFIGLVSILGAALLAPAVARADAAAEADYVTLHTALQVGRACPGALKFVEYLAVERLAYAILQGTVQFQQNRDGRMNDEAYTIWLDNLEAKAAEQAQAVGCQQDALSFVLTARAKASEEIYQDLILAFHFAGLPEEDMYRSELNADQVQAAQIYEGFLREVYGGSFDQFAATQQQQAARRLPRTLEPNGFGSGFVSYSFVDMEQLGAAQLAALSTIGRVQFEVSAEMSGRLVKPISLPSGAILPSLAMPDASQPDLPLIVAPTAYSGLGERAMPYAMALTGDGKLRLLAWGTLANSILAQPTVRLYVPNEGPPEGMTNYMYFAQPDWRDGTTMFEGERLAETCMGAPCYEFGPEAVAALAALPDWVEGELFIGGAPDTEPPPIAEHDFRPGRISNIYLKALLP